LVPVLVSVDVEEEAGLTDPHHCRCVVATVWIDTEAGVRPLHCYAWPLSTTAPGAVLQNA
jgi:hypothetical protein